MSALTVIVPAAVVAVAVVMVRRAVRRQPRRYRLDELTDLSRLDIDGLIERDRRGQGRAQ